MTAFRLRALPRCESGAAIAEFALVAPAVFLCLFGTVEVARMLWTKQTLDEVAYSTARCMTVSDACATPDEQKTYAVQRAAGYGITLSLGEVTPAKAVDCRGFPDSNRITIDAGMSTVLEGFLPTFTNTIRSQACFPSLS